MTYEDFETLIEAYGAKPEKWPEHIRDAAQNYMRDNSLESSPLIKEARDTDQMLDSYNIKPNIELLQARIMKQVSETSQNNRKPVAANNNFINRKVAAALIVAFGAGFMGLQILPTNDASDPILDNLFAEAADDEWADLATTLGVEEIYDWVEG